MDENYHDGNRAFLQSFMSRGILTLPEDKAFLAAILRVHEGREITVDQVSQAVFDSYISAAANAVSDFDYEIRSVRHQTTKKKIYAFVNSVSDPLTQIATTRTPDELLYIKRLLDAIFETNNTRRMEGMAIKSMQALEAKVRKGTAEKGLSQSEAETVLVALEKDHWLERSRAGFYSLAPRALMELRSWLVDTYNEPDDPQAPQRIKFCEACKEIVTVGQRCANVDCSVRLHDICEVAYWKSRPTHDCPKCQTTWDANHRVGEKAMTRADEILKRKRGSC
ncbi:hypothetical protein K3495_g2531 [Podosphaera aphanis]|nr:hypothetical protein K3495_g2531 [Podosphaera aphanis]